MNMMMVIGKVFETSSIYNLYNPYNSYIIQLVDTSTTLCIYLLSKTNRVTLILKIAHLKLFDQSIRITLGETGNTTCNIL